MFGSETFDGHGPWSLEHDVGRVEAGRNDIELVSFETNTLFETKDFGITYSL